MKETDAMPFASFVIPVYRTEQYLKRCLDSLVAQTDGDFEAIVVDDGSPEPLDGAAVTSDPRVRFLRHDRNRSTFQAKATAVAAATGAYVLPLDSDDSVGPELVARVRAEAAVADSPDVIVYQMTKIWRGRSHPVKYNHPSARISGADALRKLFDGRIFMPVCGKAIRRDVFRAASAGLAVGRDFYLNFTDDLCWLLPILFNAKRVSFIDYLGYFYWRHDDSMTKNAMDAARLKSLAEQSRRSVEAVVAYAERLKLPDATVEEIRDLLCPTIRWLMRDMGQSRAAVESVYGADLVARTERWDAAAGGAAKRLLRHLRTYGLAATAREVVARLRHEEI